MTTSCLALSDYVRAVYGRLHSVVKDPRLHPDQQRLLVSTVSRFEAHADPNCHAQPLGLLHLVLRAWRGLADERAVHGGAFCALYLCAADLLDDVQDEDLAGKPHAEAGPAIALNSGLALLFLAFDELRRTMELESCPETRVRLLEAFNRVSVMGVGCQHADLLGERAAATPADVLRVHAGKTSSVALFMEIGALLAGCDPRIVHTYRLVGEKLACVVQIVDDVRDVFAKAESPDLKGGKQTYPVACFAEVSNADGKMHFRELLDALPTTLQELRDLLYSSGAIDSCAHKLDELRRELREHLRDTGNAHANHRLLLRIVDSLCAAVYEVESVADADDFWLPTGGIHAQVRAEVFEFITDVADIVRLEPPRLEPWQLPHFMYVPETDTIHYPDIDDLPEETLRFHSRFCADGDLMAAARLVRLQLPFVVAHEMMHCWRHRERALTDDHWHEEYVANQLAVTYLRNHRPDQLNAVVSQANSVSVKNAQQFTPQMRVLLAKSPEYRPGTKGYELDAFSSALVHAEMVRTVAETPGDLSEHIGRYL